MAEPADAGLSYLLEQIADLQIEMAALKAGLSDKRWDQVSLNFIQLDKNMANLDSRISQIEEALDELRRERAVPAEH